MYNIKGNYNGNSINEIIALKYFNSFRIIHMIAKGLNLKEDYFDNKF